MKGAFWWYRRGDGQVMMMVTALYKTEAKKSKSRSTKERPRVSSRLTNKTRIFWKQKPPLRMKREQQKVRVCAVPEGVNIYRICCEICSFYADTCSNNPTRSPSPPVFVCISWPQMACCSTFIPSSLLYSFRPGVRVKSLIIFVWEGAIIAAAFSTTCERCELLRIGVG